MSVKGGYQILNLQNKDLQYSPTIPGAYEVVEGNYLKPIMISGIVIGGVEKPAVYRQPVVSGSSYVFENVYGYDVTLSDGDQLSLASTQFATRGYVDSKIVSEIEGGTIDNAKPIYCHPCSISWRNGDASEYGRIQCLIFNNSPTAFTIDTFKTAIDEMRASAGQYLYIMLTGGFIVAAGGYSDGKMTIAQYIYEETQGDLRISGVSVDSARENILTNWSTVTGNLVFFTDGVNKIN